MDARSLRIAGLTLASAGAAMSAEAKQFLALGYGGREAAQNWGGTYFGAHGGVGSQKSDLGEGDRDLTAGAQAGYNFQYGSSVLGIEAEASWIDNTRVKVPGGALNERMRTALKAKAGMTFNSVRVYGLAGITMTKFDEGAGVAGPDKWQQGYMLGAGTEKAFDGGLSAKLEYNRVVTEDVATSDDGLASKSDLRGYVFKAGLNYRF